MRAWTVLTQPDQPLVGQHSENRSGVCSQGRRTSAVPGVWFSLHSLWAAFWAECARDAAHPLRSVTGCRAMQLRSLER